MTISETAFWYFMGVLGSLLLLAIWLLRQDKKDQRYYEEMQRKYANGELNANT